MISLTAGGGVALVEHLLGARALAAPVHMHTREDEYADHQAALEAMELRE